jgi:hypothetical protein
LLGRQGVGGGAQDRQHELSGLVFQEFFQVTEVDAGHLEQAGEAGLGGLRPGDERFVGNKIRVDNIRYHIYDI